MAGADNHLRYGVWDGVNFQVQYDSSLPESGYQSAVTYDLAGTPVILSIDKLTSQVLFTTMHSGRWTQSGLSEAAVSDDLLVANTLSVARTNTDIHIAWVDPWGNLAYGKLHF